MSAFFSNYGPLMLVCVAGIEGILCALLLRRVERLKKRLNIAVSAAEDAARAAAMAAPGGIDPEVVISLLREGQPVSLDVIYSRMEHGQAAVASEAEPAEHVTP